ncbi:hypothetical protein SU69_05560 [Thermosipho melanesiensis]|uniref:KAP P-loop domain protein n=2 Tax=Thermosipho melanesiensis TaxID=46541 RepID=A6LLZ9_THEM4|nr:P-loop NTPase fold protein [Thermosipho melanesiensis]ABR30950.1 KAP P-loop domain protein [Thermosipho melanesiensis BI429]APT74876.1 hypothetical protein BW47_05825 [Thermosipho melanesiensis]OOC35992.1 hypothetical protein SU68_05620 [Thermosipho melanesiensis]OOC38131.1 hypothetical protein SU69_05560 [Thermosipho melanesiensis]OOC38260.1 hypothetical protein SU70_05570 [Thermosipho melanesiensis]
MGDNRTLFVSDVPTTDDQFETHSKIAKQMANFIEGLSEGTTIALKGKWGSGKSSVIEILKEKTKEKSNFKIFVFDVWAELGHNFRQAFLLNFLDWSTQEFGKDLFEEPESDYEKRRLEIIGKRKKIMRNVTPTNRTALLHLFVLILMLTLVPNFISFLLNNLSTGVVRILSFLAIYSFPLTILLAYYFISVKEEIFKSIRKKSLNKFWKKFLYILYYIFYIIVGKYGIWLWLVSYGFWVGLSIKYLVNPQSFNENFILLLSVGIYLAIPISIWLATMITKKTKNLIPIVSMYSGLLIGNFTDHEETRSLGDNSLDFKKEFIDILNKITTRKNGKIKIIIVIDNVDRIPEEKVDEVFAALKPFMISDESKKNNVLKNVFYIIPFDPGGIRIETDKGGYDYFNKLFKKEFYVPEPVYGSWHLFLDKLLKENGINIDEHIFEIALQIGRELKIYLDSYSENNKKDNKDSREYYGKNEFNPPTPREIKKFINNFISVCPRNEKASKKDIFPYALFAALKTYGILESSSNLEEILCEEIIEDTENEKENEKELKKDKNRKSFFENFLIRKGYTGYSFIDIENLEHQIFGIYYNISPQESYIVLNRVEIEKILKTPSYTTKFKDFISSIPKLTKNDTISGTLKEIFKGLNERIFNTEPQILVFASIYLKELKELKEEVYNELKDIVFSFLREQVDNDRELVSKIDNLFEIEADDQENNILKALSFIYSESGIDLINPVLKYSKYKGIALETIIFEKVDVDMNNLKKGFDISKEDAEQIIIILESIGEKYNDINFNMKDRIEKILYKTMIVNEKVVEQILEFYKNGEIDESFLNVLKGLSLILELNSFKQEKESIYELILSNFEILRNKVISNQNIDNPRRKLFSKYLLTIYRYYYNLKFEERVLHMIKNNWKKIATISETDTKKFVESAIFTIIVTCPKFFNVEFDNNFLDEVLTNTDQKILEDLIKEYEMIGLMKKEEIFKLYDKLTNISSKHINRINIFYKIICENLLENEKKDLEWIFKNYKTLRTIGFSQEEILEYVKQIAEVEEYSIEKLEFNESNIELWDEFLELEEKKREELKARIVEQIRDKFENFKETLFVDLEFYEFCTKYEIKIVESLHKYIFEGILNLELLSDAKKVDIIMEFIKKQNEEFKLEFIRDIKGSIRDIIYSNKSTTDIIENVSNILGQFNPILRILVNEKKLKNELSDESFIDSVKNITPQPSEHIQEFLNMMKMQEEKQ